MILRAVIVAGVFMVGIVLLGCAAAVVSLIVAVIRDIVESQR